MTEQSVEEDARSILRLTDPGACWRTADGSLQVRVSHPVDGGSFRRFHGRLVRPHGVAQYALHWESGASVVPHTGEPFDDAEPFPSHFRVVVDHRDCAQNGDGGWMRWLSAPASAELSVVYRVRRAPPVGCVVDWSRCPHPVRAPLLTLHLSGIEDPGLGGMVTALQRSGSNVRSVYIKLSRIPRVQEQILGALRTRTLGASVRPCRLWMCVPDLTDDDRATIGAIAEKTFTDFRWVESSAALPRASDGDPCTAPVEHLPATVFGNIATHAGGAALSLVNQRVRDRVWPHPLLSVQVPASQIRDYADGGAAVRVGHLRVFSPPGGGGENAAAADTPQAIEPIPGDRFSNLRSLWMSGVSPNTPAGAAPPPLRRLQRFHWDRSTVSPEAAAACLRHCPADRVSLRLVLSIDGSSPAAPDHRDCEALFAALESLTCKWLGLSVMVAPSSDRSHRRWMDWSRVRPIRWPSTLRRLELRLAHGGGEWPPPGNYVPVAQSVLRGCPDLNHARIDMPYPSVLASSDGGAPQPPARALFCVGLVGGDPDDGFTERMSALLRACAAHRYRIVADVTDCSNARERESVANDICWDVQDTAAVVPQDIQLDVLVGNSGDARQLTQDMGDSHHNRPSNLRTIVRYPPVRGDNAGPSVVPGGLFPVAPADADWLLEGPIPESAYGPAGNYE